MDFEEERSFGELLARYRTGARKSRRQLATCLGVHHNTVFKWEQKGSLPKDRTRIEEIVRCLKLTEPQHDALLRAALLNIPHLIQNLPSPRNPFFTGRDQELEHLHTQLQQRTTAAIGQTQSVSGLGGIGKTQLAVEYAYRYHEEYQYVLWARAESVEALTASFTEIADRLNLPEKNAQEQAITIQAVKRWLQRQHGWLLILDNADSPDLLPDFLPPTVGGHLLITTRAADVSAHIAGSAHPLVVETFSDEQSALFLLHRSNLLALDATLDQAETHARQLALEIAHELGNLPLALDQAGAYLKTTGSNLVTYQQIYQQRRAQILKERRGTEHPQPVATTWDISFSIVVQKNAAAADLLSLCAFFDPDGIPEELLRQGADELGPTLTPIVTDAYLLNEAIESLCAFSLIARNPHTQSLTIHRLIQAVLKDQMDEQDRKLWAERAVQAVNAAFPKVEHQTWPQCDRLLPHALVCAELIAQEQMTFLEAAHLLNQAGYYLDDRARYAEAEPLYQRALSIREQMLGPDHPDTAQSLNNLAVLYRTQGKYGQAEPLYQRALSISEQQLGPEHPHTATSLNNLALLYQDQGKYEQAEPLCQRALSISEQQLGPDHPSTATSLNNLAVLYRTQGKDKQAEPLYQRALSISEQQLGPDHPDTATSLNNLALLYQDQGQDEQAEPLYLRALSISEQQVGPDHPSTATSLNNLALLYHNQGKYEQAEPLYLRALSIHEQQLGAQHPDTATSLNNLALLYHNQGKDKQAEPLLQRALSISEQQLGAQHPHTATSLNNLAGLYLNQGKDKQAEPLYQRALVISEQQLGPDHPHTAQSLNNLAALYRAQGKYEQAEPLFKRALSIYEQQLGPHHPDTTTSLNNLAGLYKTQSKYEQAESLYQRALVISEQQLGPDHPHTAQSLNNLAALYRAQDKYEQAEPLYLRALAIREQQLGSQHPNTALSVWWLADLSEQQQQYEQAASLYQRALSIYEQQLGPQHPHTQTIRANYADLLRTMGHDTEATALDQP